METVYSSRTLSLEFKRIQANPVEGFLVNLNDNNLYLWDVAIFGPPETIYEGGYFKAQMTFPTNYPYSPPTLRFIDNFWHPNVYENGQICISILHPSNDDPTSGELPSERWNPAQNVRTILLSVISLLNEPNINSPANVDASKMYQRWKQSNGEHKQFEVIIKRSVEHSKLEAQKDGIVVPTTIRDYCLMKFKVGANGKAEAEKDFGLDKTVVTTDEYYDESYLFEGEEKEENDVYYNDDYYSEDYIYENEDDEDDEQVETQTQGQAQDDEQVEAHTQGQAQDDEQVELQTQGQVQDDEQVEAQTHGQVQDAQNILEVTTQADDRNVRDPAIEWEARNSGI